MYSSSKANLWIVAIKQSNSTCSNATDGAQTAQMLPIRNQTWSKWQQKVAMRCQDVCERSQNSSNILQDDSKMSPKIFRTHTTGLKWSQVDSKSFLNGPQTPQDGSNSRQDGPKMSPRGAHVGSQIGEKVKLEVFKKHLFFHQSLMKNASRQVRKWQETLQKRSWTALSEIWWFYIDFRRFWGPSKGGWLTPSFLRPAEPDPHIWWLVTSLIRSD